MKKDFNFINANNILMIEYEINIENIDVWNKNNILYINILISSLLN